MSPDGSQKPLPEERLLRLIRGKPAKPSTTAVAAPPGARGGGPFAAQLGARIQEAPWVTLAIWGLGLILGLELILVVMQLMRPLPAVTPPAVPPSVVSSPSGEEAPLPALPSLAQSASESLFTSPSMAGPAGPAAPAGPSQTGRLLASRLTLMGIMSGEPPQAIIEDSETKKTYFVTTGQAVTEGATLEQVLDNRVILDLNGEKIELSL